MPTVDRTQKLLYICVPHNGRASRNSTSEKRHFFKHLSPSSSLYLFTTDGAHTHHVLCAEVRGQVSGVASFFLAQDPGTKLRP